MTFLYAWETQTLCSANWNPPPPISSDALLGFERHSANTSYLLASATRGKHCPSTAHAPEEQFFLPFLFFAGSKFDCMFVLAHTPFLYFSPFHSNIINTFHSCQSKKLKLTYIKAPHPSYISRSRMGRGWRAEINVLERFPVSVCVRVCECAPRARRGTEDWMCESESAC